MSGTWQLETQDSVELTGTFLVFDESGDLIEMQFIIDNVTFTQSTFSTTTTVVNGSNVGITAAFGNSIIQFGGTLNADVTTADGDNLYTLYRNDKTGDVLAVLPRSFEKQMCFVAPTFAAGMPGRQSSMIDGYLVKWKRIGDRLALIQPALKR